MRYSTTVSGLLLLVCLIVGLGCVSCVPTLPVNGEVGGGDESFLDNSELGSVDGVDDDSDGLWATWVGDDGDEFDIFLDDKSVLTGDNVVWNDLNETEAFDGESSGSELGLGSDDDGGLSNLQILLSEAMKGMYKHRDDGGTDASLLGLVSGLSAVHTELLDVCAEIEYEKVTYETGAQEWYSMLSDLREAIDTYMRDYDALMAD